MDLLKKFEMPDDKELVIYAVAIISMTALCLLKADALPIVHDALIGLFGIAVGKSMAK